MNLTTEQIDIVIQHCKTYSIGGVDILAICDMAKRTAEAEAALRDKTLMVGQYITAASNDQIGMGEDPIGFLVASHAMLTKRYLALKNAATQTDVSARNVGALEQPAPITANAVNAPVVAAPDLVERLLHRAEQISTATFRHKECEALMREAAAALAEREKDAEKFIDEWKHPCGAVCAEVSLWTNRCPHCGMPAIDALRSRS